MRRPQRSDHRAPGLDASGAAGAGVRALAACLLLLGCVRESAGEISREAPGGTRQPAPRGLVVILADDLGYEGLACNGGEYATPALDRLAAEGLRFEHAYATPLCTPSRVQLMTGRYGHRNYVGFGRLAPGERTFANVLRDAGYATCVAGKWQLGGDAAAIDAFGFDRHCLWNLHDYDSSSAGPSPGEPATAFRRYEAPTLFVDGEWVEHGPEEYGPDVCLRFVEAFLREHAGEPFLVYYPMLLPHFEGPEAVQRADPQALQREFRAMVGRVDAAVGRIREVLAELGRLDDTLLVFTADNGSPAFILSETEDGVRRGGKASLTDAGTHVPLIVRGPAVHGAGRATGALVDLSDILPTLVEVAGASPPAPETIDGVSFAPVLRDERESVRDWVYCYFWDEGRDPERVLEFARDRRWKLYDDDRLFDVRADPREEHPLPAEGAGPEARAARERLEAALAQARAGAG